MKKILFIDRDGTLIEEPADAQIDSLEKFNFLPGVFSSLQRLSTAGYKFVMVTNQDGLGTSSNPIEKFEMIQNLLLKVLKSQGIEFSEILICPHFAKDNCNCRKPKTELVHRYLAMNDMDRDRSFVIGDRETDRGLAKNMGLKAFILTQNLDWKKITHDILDQPRKAKVLRETKETKISLDVDIDGSGKTDISTGVGFLDHMLEQVAQHGGMDLFLRAEGDLHIDDHHLIEDVALALGAGLKEALGNRVGIERYGFWLPMDEASSHLSIDLSNRPSLVFEMDLGKHQAVAGVSMQMIKHFFQSLALALGAAIHIKSQGENTHHLVESAFKALGRSLKLAAQRSQNQSLPSTKGVL